MCTAHTRFVNRTLRVFIVTFLFSCAHAIATPPEYLSFKREQSKNPTIEKDDLIRIWMIYVGQGDAILIQIPGALAGQEETFDVLIDAGSLDKSDARRANEFLSKLYEGTSTLEHVVISHHDSDHVSGLGHILENENVIVDHIWHNGLATYDPAKLNLNQQQLKNTVNKKNSRGFERIMGEIDATDGTIKPDYLVHNLVELRNKSEKFQGVYKMLAESILQKDPIVKSFDFAHHNSNFIEANNDNITFEPLWPLDRPSKFGDWGQTINGNSLTFKFSYKNFEILFTGDHNQLSEPALLEYLTSQDLSSVLECDVLKVPHHGSNHASEEFFKSEYLQPVISVASMGNKGFNGGWKHPSTSVISYLGGAHRFYSTHIHERKFDYTKLSAHAREELVEKTHILIETDGNWFRIVEIPVDEFNSEEDIPDIKSIKRGDGTLWIKTSL